LAAQAFSGLRRHEQATRGVRADRVGAKLPSRAIVVGRCRTNRRQCLVRPLARDSRLAAHRKVRRHPRCSSNRKDAGGKQAALLGDQKRGRVGFGRTVVVLAGRIGCRSRQAALGPSRPRAKSSWFTTSGLAASRESVEVANERRKPNRRRQSREIGGGSPITTGSSRKRPCWRHSVDGRRSGPGKSLSLTRGRWQRFWLFAKPGFPGMAVRDRERQRSFVSSAGG
jgi:hypothetical protein